MTKREAAIVSAYTGYLIGEFSDFQAYAEEVMGRPIFTHDLTRLEYELKEKSKKDFMNIKIVNEDKKKEDINIGYKFKDRCPSYSGWCEGIDYPDERCFSYILSDYENEKKKTEDLERIYHSPFERASWVDFDAVEKALGFRLFGYQKSYILGQGFRQMGRTTAEILHQLLSVNEEPIDFSRPAPSKHISIFRQQFRDIWEKLRDAGIEMRPVFWSKEDKKKYEKESMNKFDPYKYARTWLDEYDKGHQDGKKAAIDNFWSELQDRTKKKNKAVESTRILDKAYESPSSRLQRLWIFKLHRKRATIIWIELL